MLIIVDKVTKTVITNMGTNAAFPTGDIPNIILTENEEMVKIPDDSELTLKILAAEPHSYSLIFDAEGNCIDAVVTKTLVEWQAEQPAPPYTPTIEERLEAAEAALNDLILGGGA